MSVYCGTHRGEKLSAMRFIQVTLLTGLLSFLNSSKIATAAQDPFNLSAGMNFDIQAWLNFCPNFYKDMKGITKSALAVLTFLDKHFGINAAMKQAVL